MDWNERASATEEKLRSQFLAALGGDPAAYREFLVAVAAHLRAFFRRRLAQLPDEVEDLVQETLLAVHQSRHTYDADQPLTAWLHTIARYKLVDLLRARGRREALHEPLDDDLQIVARSDTEAAEARHDLEKVLRSLPDRQRQALMMTKVEGASVAEVSAATGMSESAIKVSVHRGLKALAAKLRGTP
jgi:RNA polymerase sigma-70 factor (ECF subfamily)